MKKLILILATAILVVLCATTLVACGTPPCEHSYSAKIKKDPTCTETGSAEYTCVHCGHKYTDEFESYNASEVHDKYQYSIGEIVTYTKSGDEYALGTGFVYGTGGKIITNYHVIENAYSAKFTINETSFTVNSVLAYDKDIDLAVLKISTGTSNLKPVKMCMLSHNVGDTVYAYGSSQGLTATFSQGIITYNNREIENVTYVQHDAAISSGNSGGPLINQYGEVIGINTMTIIDSQNLNFAISTTEISNLVFGTPLSMSEFYEKECSAFNRVKNFIIQNGTYDSADNEYEIEFGYATVNSYLRYETSANYNVSENTIDFWMFLDDTRSSSSDCMVRLTINASVNGIYEWSWIDVDYDYLSGNIYASTFNSNYVLSYNNYIGLSSYSERTAACELASTMMNLLLVDIEIDYEEVGVTAYDFGFLNY